MKECNCDMRTKLVGDGCEVCNPEQALEHARDTIADLKQERDEAVAMVEVMRGALRSIIRPDYGRSYGGPEDLRKHINTVSSIASNTLSLTPSAALKEIQARTREEDMLISECLRYLADLNGSQWIKGDGAGEVDMRQRAIALQLKLAASKRKGE